MAAETPLSRLRERLIKTIADTADEPLGKAADAILSLISAWLAEPEQVERMIDGYLLTAIHPSGNYMEAIQGAIAALKEE